MRTIATAVALLGSVETALAAKERWVWVTPTGDDEQGGFICDFLSSGGTMVADADGISVWSEEDGLVRVPNPPPWSPWVYPRTVLGMSADGSRVLFELVPYGGEYRVWTRGVGFQQAHDVFAGLAPEDRIYTISRDGHSVMGMRVEGLTGGELAGPAARWFDDGTVQELGIMPGFDGSAPFLQSRDGSVAAGYSHIAGDSWTGFLWTMHEGFLKIPAPVGFRGPALLVLSADGSTCGGVANTHTDERGKPMLWRRDTGYRILDYPGPEYGTFDSGRIDALTHDGAIALGFVRGEFVSEDFLRIIWTEETGVVPAADYVNGLIEHPTYSEDGYHAVWVVGDVLDMSDDGRTFLVHAGWEAEWDDDGEDGKKAREYYGSMYIVTITPDGECPGDITGNGLTTAADFNVLARHFREEVPAGTLGDVTGNGVVTVTDFNVLVNDFGCGG